MTRSLDVGCGSVPNLDPAEVQVGIDIDFTLLLQSRRLYPKAHFVCGDGPDRGRDTTHVVPPAQIRTGAH
jgi:hypothetical protein